MDGGIQSELRSAGLFNISRVRVAGKRRGC